MSSVVRWSLIVASASAVSMALANDTVVHAELPKACQMSGSLTGSIPPVPGIYTLGNLGFSCNYGGNVSIGMTSANGTVLRNLGEPSAPGLLYLIKWEVPPNMPWQSSSTSESFGPWIGFTGPTPNQVRSEAVKVWLLETATIGGTYSDTVTFTVSPI